MKIRGVISVPGDKSISHRALIFSALSRGKVRIAGLSSAEDCRSTAQCLQKLGMRIVTKGETAIAQEVTVESPGIDNLRAPKEVLNAANSGTTMRIISGLVAGRPFMTRFDGDDSLRMRPMSRVLLPLYEMGAKVHYESSHDMAPVADTAPFSITGGNLVGKSFELKIASAQVQTALLLAGLQAGGTTSVKTPGHVRDHTERMFKHMGVPFKRTSDGTLEVSALTEPVAPFSISVPGDLSSAAFFMVAAACLPGSDILIKNVGVNAGRTLIIDVLRRMGADVHFESQGEVSGEPVADIRVRYSGRLRGVTVYGDTIATGIDEIPILSLAGSLCEGEFTVLGADELRHKETNRLASIIENLQNLGVNIEATSEGFKIQGAAKLAGASFWRTYGDHRMAMTGMIANVISQEPITLEESESVKISYPSFEAHLKLLLGEKTGVT